MLVPINLSADYARLPKAIWNQPYFYWHIILITFFAFALFLIWRRMDKIFRMGLVFFLATLVPTLGLLPFFYQTISTVADRYAYLPLAGFCLMVSSFCTTKARNIFVGLVIFIFAAISTSRTYVWKDDQRFFSEILIAQPNSASAHIGIGNYYLSTKDFAQATRSFEFATRLDSKSATSYANLLLCLNLQGFHEKVISAGNEALNQDKFQFINEYTEGLAAVYLNLGYAYLQNGDAEKSFKAYCSASKHNPNSNEIESRLNQIKALVINSKCY